MKNTKYGTGIHMYSNNNNKLKVTSGRGGALRTEKKENSVKCEECSIKVETKHMR